MTANKEIEIIHLEQESIVSILLNALQKNTRYLNCVQKVCDSILYREEMSCYE